MAHTRVGMSSDDSPRSPLLTPDPCRVLAEVGQHLLREVDREAGLSKALTSLHGVVRFDWAGLTRPEEGGFVLSDTFRADERSGLRRVEPPPLVLSADPAGRAGAQVDTLRDYLATEECRGMLAVPLGPDQGGRGSLLLARAAPPFRQGEADLARAVGSLLSAAQVREESRRNLEQRIEERATELSAIHEVGRGLGHALDLEEVERIVFQAVERLVGGDAIALLVDLGGHMEVIIRVTRPLAREVLEALRRDLIAEHEARVGVRGLHPDFVVRRSPDYAAEETPLRAPLTGGAAVPLTRRGKTTGLLRVARHTSEPLSEDRLRLLFTVASQVSLSLDRMETLREREQSRVGQMLDSMPQGVLLADADLNVLVANPAARSMLTQLAGNPDPPRLERCGGLEVASLAAPVLSGERDRTTAEVSLPAARRIFSLSFAPVRGDGHVRDRRAGVVVLIDDVTEERRLQEQMDQTEKLSALGEMIAGVAHELNNPLATVLGFAQILQASQPEGPVGEKLATLYREARRCQKIVQNLLSFARKHEPRKQPLSLGVVVESILQLVRYQLRVADIEVQVTLSPELPPVMGDQHALQQVFINLVTNAQHAMEEKGGGGVLRIQGIARDDMVRIEVSDTGQGIRPEDLKRIFDPFFSTKEVGKGTGLGLSLAYGTVRDHGGTIEAASRRGEGTTFIVILPAARPEEVTRFMKRAVEGSRTTKIKGKTILVVEDEGPVAEVLQEALQNEGHQVVLASDGIGAHQRLDLGGIDLVISDLRMPRMGGRELYERICHQHPKLSRRVVFATGDLMSTEAREFCERTGNPVLEKPFDLAEVRRVVARALETD